MLLPLPPYSPELNPVENVWEFLRGNSLSHRVWETYEEIMEACRYAWNQLMQMPDRICQRRRENGSARRRKNASAAALRGGLCR